MSQQQEQRTTEDQAIINRQQPTICSICATCKRGVCSCGFQETKRRIIFPFDFAMPDQKEAYDYMIKNLYQEGDEIIFLHIVPSTYRRAFKGTMAVGLKADDDWREKAVEFVGTVRDEKDKFTQAQIVLVSYDPSDRSVGEVICRKALEYDARLIFMAVHHQNRIREFFMGSGTFLVLRFLFFSRAKYLYFFDDDFLLLSIIYLFSFFLINKHIYIVSNYISHRSQISSCFYKNDEKEKEDEKDLE
jgi:nucleotide-binding universal stress UspA family protein